MSVIAISGKSRSGKDTVGEILQYLTSDIHHLFTFDEFRNNLNDIDYANTWKIKKFAYKVKQITSILTGISIDDLEKEEVKQLKLPKCWNKSQFIYSKPSSMTVRQFMYTLATDAIRDTLHTDTWVNALFSEYDNSSNWIITDWRFPNEENAIKKHNGLTIRVKRHLSFRYPEEYEKYSIDCYNTDITFIEYCYSNYRDIYKLLAHPSETRLDEYEDTSYFKYTIDNNGSMKDLIEKCREILIKEKLI